MLRNRPMHTARSVCFLLLALLLVPGALAKRPLLPPVPAEIASPHFLVTIDGQPTPVMHAAMNLYFLNFPAGKHTRVTVTADTDDFWNAGVDIQPWRLGIRPRRNGRTLSFTLDGPQKITISRPGDFLGDADMLFLFANPAEVPPPAETTPGFRIITAGVHTENLDPQSGETLYLAPGAVLFGSLNLWQVHDVRVFGPGVLVYDGPQNPADDDGWMHKRNWHCIVMDQATDISISDLTCVVRSRTWQIQMKGSHRITFDNLKVIGANPGNANADGMDWLGGGDTVVRNSFFRAADDVFALQSSWEGYGPVAFAVQGEPVRHITVENTFVSTSISNIVRAAWPQKNFQGGDLTLRNIDVLHAGLGGCGVPFAFMELWADPLGRGTSGNYTFSDIRLDDWYSLLSFQQPTPVEGIHFTDISSLRTPPAVASILKGDIRGVTLDNLTLAGNPVDSAAGLPLRTEDGAGSVTLTHTGPTATVSYTAGWLRPGQKIHFQVGGQTPQIGVHYQWLFGDGSSANGRRVSHRFPDAAGTALDGSGLFHVLLHLSTDAGRHTWIAVPVVISGSQTPPVSAASATPRPLAESAPPSGALGVAWALQPAPASAAATGEPLTSSSPGQGDVASVPAPEPASSGVARSFDLAEISHPATEYQLSLTSDLEIPSDGGYIFTLVANDGASLTLDGHRLGSTPGPFAQVCGLAGNAARMVTVAAELAQGRHHLQVTNLHHAGQDNFELLWQGPGIPLQPLSPSLLHLP